MAKLKFYAVLQGRKPGIYTAWFGAHGAEAQVKGFTGAVYKSFADRSEAEMWFNEPAPESLSGQQTMLFHSCDIKNSREKTTRRSKQHANEMPHPRAAVLESRATVYTDGGCSKNPGPGGYGAVLLVGGERRELSGGFAHTTNNRMELTACIKALEALDGSSPVTVHTDSQYVVNGIMKGWAKRWKCNNWMRNADEPAENSDLWSQLLELCDRQDVMFQWVRGHSGNQENERCDRLAVEMTKCRDLPPDRGYKKK